MKKYLLRILVLIFTFMFLGVLHASGTEPSEYLVQLPTAVQELLTAFIEHMPANADLEDAIKGFGQQLSSDNELRAFVDNPIILEVIVRSYVERFGFESALQELTKAIDRADEPVIRVLLSTGIIPLNKYSIERNTYRYTPLGYALLLSPVDTVAFATRVLPVLEQFGADARKPSRIISRKAKS